MSGLYRSGLQRDLGVWLFVDVAGILVINTCLSTSPIQNQYQLLMFIDVVHSLHSLFVFTNRVHYSS